MGRIALKLLFPTREPLLYERLDDMCFCPFGMEALNNKKKEEESEEEWRQRYSSVKSMMPVITASPSVSTVVVVMAQTCTTLEVERTAPVRSTLCVCVFVSACVCARAKGRGGD